MFNCVYIIQPLKIKRFSQVGAFIRRFGQHFQCLYYLQATNLAIVDLSTGNRLNFVKISCPALYLHQQKYNIFGLKKNIRHYI